MNKTTTDPRHTSKKRTRVLVAGGAGFLGSHLCRALLERGDEVTCIDNMCTGRRENVRDLESRQGFSSIVCDISHPLPAIVVGHPYDAIINLASPASIPSYTRLALETLMVGSVGSKQLLDLAQKNNARYIHSSTSEVYGEPAISPQPETYRGNVNSYGGRAMYDEAKRFAEALIWVYRYQHGVDTGIARIFNTYGPRMAPDDGRVVSNFIVQALRGESLTIYGNGEQTRSFCYVDDQIRGLLALLDSGEEGPINIGNPGEFTVRELAEIVVRLTGSKSRVIYKPLPPDDPTQRKPDIERAKKLLNWQPTVSLEEGLELTIDYYKKELGSVTV